MIFASIIINETTDKRAEQHLSRARISHIKKINIRATAHRSMGLERLEQEQHP